MRMRGNGYARKMTTTGCYYAGGCVFYSFITYVPICLEPYMWVPEYSEIGSIMQKCG